MNKPYHRPGSHQRKLVIPREKSEKKEKRKKCVWGGRGTLKGQLVQLLHFCGFVDVAEAKEKDMTMVEREKRRRPGVINTAVYFYVKCTQGSFREQ